MHNVYQFLEQQELFIVRPDSCPDEYAGEVGLRQGRPYDSFCRLSMIDKTYASGVAAVVQRHFIPPQTRFDAVLAWDLFNYLPAGLLRDLAAHLSRYCIAGTPLYALIAARSEIPAEPMRFRVRDERHVTYEPASAATRPSPGHSPRELETLIPGFGVSRSVLLRNGMQEHVFVRT